MLYLFVKYLTRVGLRAYFKKIYITGKENIPRDKPVLFAANHTNGLVDPVFIGANVPHTVHFLTRSDVFTPATEGIFKQLNMYPIYRIKDGYHLLSRNDATFAKCFEVLKKNGNIIIFSEGDCEAEKQLRPLKKGTARMAFQALEDFGLDVHIVPTSFNYTEHTGFRSDVMLHFGKAFSVKEFDETRKANKARGIKAFNKRLKDGLQANLIHLDDLENKDLLEPLLEVKRTQLITPATPIFNKKDTTRLTEEQKIADSINQMPPEKLGDFKETIIQFSESVKQKGLSIAALGRSGNILSVLILILLYPLFFLFSMVNGFPLWLSDYLVKQKVKQDIFVSTFRCFLMIFLYFFVWLFLSIFAIIFFGKWGMLFAILTPITAYLAIFYKDILDFELGKWRFSNFKKKHPKVAADFVKKKEAILAEL